MRGSTVERLRENITCICHRMKSPYMQEILVQYSILVQETV